MTRLKLTGSVSNERQLVLYETILYETTKDDEKIVLLLVEKKIRMNIENSVVRQNVTRDFRICLAHSLLIHGQIAMKF